MRWRIIPYESYPAALNMAIDHMLLEQVKETNIPTIRFYGWENGGVSIGKHQHAGIVHTDRCNAKHIDYVRRPTGGNVVYHHPADLTYAVIAPTSCFGQGTSSGGTPGVHREAYKTICTWIVQAL